MDKRDVEKQEIEIPPTIEISLRDPEALPQDRHNSSSSSTNSEAPVAPKAPIVDWSGPDDPTNPQNWPLGLKIYHTFIPAAFAFLTTFASTIYVLGRDKVMAEFHVNSTVSLLPYSLFVLGIVIGPIIAAPCSELFGRKLVYHSSVPIFAVFIAGAGASQSITALIICRFFAGLFGSPGMSIGSGTIADVWELKSRPIPMAILIAAPFCGPAIGPVVGGFVAMHKSWRWTQWVVLLMTAALYLPALGMKETYKKVILAKQNKQRGGPRKQNSKVIAQAFRNGLVSNLFRPLQMVFTEPIVASFSIYIAFILALVYTMIAAVPYVFTVKYNFNLGFDGLIFVAFGIGFIIATFMVILITKYNVKKMIKTRTRPAPEEKLKLAKAGGVVLPVALFWFAWTAENQIHWVVPAIAMALISWSIFMIFMPCTLYIVDCYGPMYAASAVSATRIAGYMGGVAFPLFTIQMFSGLGVGWAGSLLGFVAVALCPIPWCFGRWGAKMRSMTKYSPAKTAGGGK